MNTTSLCENLIRRTAQCVRICPVVALHLSGDSLADLAATTNSHREAAIQSFGDLPLSRSARISSRCQNRGSTTLGYFWRSLLYLISKDLTKCVAQLNGMLNTCQAYDSKKSLRKNKAS